MPSRPLLDFILDHVAPHTGIVNRGNVTNDNMPTLEGRARIGTTIHVFDNGGNEPISIDSAGEVGVVSRRYDIVIDTTPPAWPSIKEGICHGSTGHRSYYRLMRSSRFLTSRGAI